ncbi:MAG: bifunctional adenosylcobinamide kinase/adenosylcobinamide-phosphate guanylyltransferase, partial [Spirochaetia bacterium]|nr:bifunctional adenosylcobinamide kinase/adenosylcobinamide-phosphate guanylyltransferase [Spirochaetia bacterium]
MRVFITGGSGAGKSAFAESTAQKLGGRLVYVATMPVASEEDKKKVERHHQLRAGKGFTTLERPGMLDNLPDDGETLLIECLSTHTANLMFDPENAPVDAADAKYWTSTIKKELSPLLGRKGNTIFVSLEITSDGTTYSKETENYKEVLTA